MTDYRKVLCVLIQDGTLTKEQARAAAKKVDLSEQTQKESVSWATAVELTEYLHERIVRNGFRPFRRGQQAILSMDRLLRIDKHPEPEIRAVIEWCSDDDFWSGNVLSPMKFRQHYDRMRWQMNRSLRAKVSAAQDQTDWEQELEKRRAESVSKPRGFLKSALQ